MERDQQCHTPDDVLMCCLKRPVCNEKRPVCNEKRPVCNEKRPVCDGKRPIMSCNRRRHDVLSKDTSL